MQFILAHQTIEGEAFLAAFLGSSAAIRPGMALSALMAATMAGFLWEQGRKTPATFIWPDGRRFDVEVLGVTTILHLDYDQKLPGTLYRVAFGMC